VTALREISEAVSVGQTAGLGASGECCERLAAQQPSLSVESLDLTTYAFGARDRLRSPQNARHPAKAKPMLPGSGPAPEKLPAVS